MYGLKDKLVSIRCDSELYNEVKEIISKGGWNRDTFGSIFDDALRTYLKKHKK